MSAGSLVNNVLENTNNNVVPEVGMGITVCMFSDRYAGTITKVSPSKKTFSFTRDKVVRVDKNGMSDCQVYNYESDPNGYEMKARIRKNGKYKTEHTDCSIILNYRDSYHDYSF